MKLLIDIPDEVYKRLFTMKPMDIADQIAIDMAIKHGIVLDDCSNREVLEKLFDAQVLFQWDLEDTCGTLIHIGGKDVVLDREWCKRKWCE